MSNYKYKELTPNDNIENGDAYFEALKQAFENDKIKNIALAGPYGSGKSSIIQSFLKKTETEGFCKRKSIKANSLIISMATFLKANDNKNDNKITKDDEDKKITKDDEDKIIIDANEVEKGILKQLFYKVDPSKIPQSRYRKLHKKDYKRIFWQVYLTFSIMLVFMCLFDTKPFININNKINSIFETNCLVAILLKYALFIAAISAMITLFIKEVACRIHIKEIKLPINATINTEIDNETIFNKNLDEIVYFFEETDYRIIFFEDLDRLDDPKIFIHLRELNNLLNNNDAINNKPVVFVYAIRDDIFSNDDRTKFFDFIIPVIPVINPTNSGEVLIKEINEVKNDSFNCDITDDFLLDISPYISDMRILQNILNEFAIYKNALLDEKGLNLSDKKMFSMILFKNIYPKEFSDIQNEKGIIKEVFVQKDIFIEDQRNKIQTEIDDYSNTLNSLNKDVLNSMNELKYAMLCSLVGGPYLIESFTKSIYDYNDKINVSKFMDNEFDMERLINENYRNIRYYKNGYTENNITIIENQLISFIERWKTLKTVNSEKFINTQNNFEKLKTEQHELSKKTLSFIFNNYQKDVLKNNFGRFESNKLLMFLLRRGYIDEDYAMYINYFKGTSITKKDMDFVLDVKNRVNNSYNYVLNKTSMVIRKLDILDFEEKAIFNFDLLKELLNEGQPEKLDILISQLSNASKDSIDFIDAFIGNLKNDAKDDNQKENGKILNHFFVLLANKWEEMFKNILSNELFNYSKRIEYLKILISSCDISVIEKQNIDDCIRKFFENNEDILQQTVECDSNKLISIIDTLEIQFRNLITNGINLYLLEHIFSNDCYAINVKMFENLIEYRNPNLIWKYKTKPYSSLIELNDENSLNYINDNIEIFITQVILKREKASDNINDIVDMISKIEGNQDLQIKLIQKEDFCLNKITECCGDLVIENKDEWFNVWDFLLKEGVVTVCLENVYDYWKVYEFTETLKEYIEKYHGILKTTDAEMIDDDFIKEFIKSEFSKNVYCSLLPELKLNEFDIDISTIPYVELEIMLNCSYFEFNTNRCNSIKNISNDLAILFIIKNQTEYIELIDDVKISNIIFEKLLFDKDFLQKNKAILFKKYAKTYMNHDIALNMKRFKKLVNNEVFDSAWNNVDADENIILLAEYADCLNNDEIEDYLYSLEVPYSELSNRNEEHEVSLLNTKNNRLLAESLKKVSYISGYKEKKCIYEYSEEEKPEECLILRVNKRSE